MKATKRRARTLRALVVAVLAICVSLAATSPASATGNDRGGKGIPDKKISIQLWTFAEYIGFGTDAATIARTEEVFKSLSDMGYENVEPFTLSGLTPEQYRALLEKYGLQASGRHVNVGSPESPVDIGPILEENRTLGLRYFGSGATPNYATEAEWIAYAEYLNELGAQARKWGQKLMVHNHNWEFQRVFGDRTAYDILQQYTDYGKVVFQLDLYWVTNGGADPVKVLKRYGKRIQLFHVKDMAAGPFPGPIEIVGEGIIDFPKIFRTAKKTSDIRYYVVEHDPRFGDPTFDPFEAAEKGFDYLDRVKF